MKLYLVGGFSKNSITDWFVVLSEIFNLIRPKQILFVPFAHVGVDGNYQEHFDRFKKELRLTFSPLFLDATKTEDLEKADGKCVFVDGGHGHSELYNVITQNPRLKDLVFNTKYYICDSAGAMAVGEWERENQPGKGIIHGLGILKSTIIEPHYTEKGRQELLKEEVEKTGCLYGVGIDEITTMVVDSKDFPNNFSVLGKGQVKLVTKDV